MGPQQNQPNIGYGPLPSGYQSPVGNASPNRKKFAIIFVVIAIILVVLTAFSILNSRKDPAEESLVNLIVAERELLRITDNVEKDLGDPATRRHHAELFATLTTDSSSLQAELKRVYGKKSVPSGKQKAAIDKKADELLESSIKLNRLDQDFAEIAAEKLAKQVELAEQTQSLTKSQQLKTSLTTVANNTNELRKRFEVVANRSPVSPATPSQ